MSVYNLSYIERFKEKSRQICATSWGLNPGEKFDQACRPCPVWLTSFEWCVHTMEGERAREWERESIGTEFYYIGVTDNKKKQTSLPANYISVWVIFFPSHLICFGPHWVFCFMRIRLPLSFYSISRIQEERKKWWLGRNLTKIIRITLVARGTFGMGWGWLWVRRTCYSSTSSLVAGSFFFAASDSFFLSLDIPSECSGIHGH